MIRLIDFLTESIVNEGGNVFDEGSEPIKLEYIKPTLEKFKDELKKIFPKASKYFDKFITLGSVGKKPLSGDIDLALDEKSFNDLNEWGLDLDYVMEKFALYKKRARSATPEQLMKRAIIVNIAEVINEKSDLISTDDKSSGSGTLFCLFPQYDENGKELDIKVQIDINFGDVDWLEFAYHSDSYAGNVKGLHRTQLMLSLFSNKGYTFSHNYGVKDKASGEIVANSPENAIGLLNDKYGFNLNKKILANYFELQKFLQSNLSAEELNMIYDKYLCILDKTRCDIPEDLQKYWIENQEKLGLTGKFLPNNSNLIALKK